MIRYHNETLSLAGCALESSAAAEAPLAAVERALQRPLPASVREVLASDGWPDFIAHFSNCDHPIRVEDLLRSRWPGYEPVANGLLPFMVENQGVCTWAVALDAGNDPEVLVEVDSGNPPTWQHAAPSFSSWLRCQVLDHQLVEKALFAAQAEPIGAEALGELERRLECGPRTFGWPAPNVYRFRGSLGSLLLWAADDQCDWWIAPAALDLASQFLDALPLAHGFDGWLYELKPEGRAVLDTWRGANHAGA